ncbi:MAG: hypothetical protein JWO03_1083 [Bacteroidetes bacterium]|nr:hypothetical protein [Bacteroidota bacterium]
MGVHLGKSKHINMLNFTLPGPATIAIAALVPTIIGFIWYNPKVFGTAWMNAAGVTPESAKGMNMPVVFGVSLLLSFLLAASLVPMVLHQFGFFSMMMDEGGKAALADHNSEIAKHAQFMMDTFGHSFHTFKHGALHGTILGIFTILPVIATGAMFERKGFKYIAINAGYWIVSLAIMGAIICHFMPYPKLG